MAFLNQSFTWVKRGLAPLACDAHCYYTQQEHGLNLRFYKCYQYENGNSDNLTGLVTNIQTISCSGMFNLSSQFQRKYK